MVSDSAHPTGARRRKHKNAAVTAADDMEPPRLPEYLSGDGPSGDDEGNDANRPRSTSTAPKSGKARDPDEYDRLMGNTSANLLKMTGWKMGN